MPWRAYHRAVANGTQLRLVVMSGMVRRVLSINGLDRLAPVYPTLDGAVAARAERPEVQGELRIARSQITRPAAGSCWIRS